MKKMTANQAAEMMKRDGLVVDVNRAHYDKRCRQVDGRIVRPAQSGNGENLSISWVQYDTWHGCFFLCSPGARGTSGEYQQLVGDLKASPQENDYFFPQGYESRNMGIVEGHDRFLREKAEAEHGGYISAETWEMMKANGEAHGCGCSICSPKEYTAAKRCRELNAEKGYQNPDHIAS